MEVIKIVGVSIFAVIMIIILKNYRPEMALVLSIITGIGENYIVIAIVVLGLLTTGIVLIKKFVI